MSLKKENVKLRRVEMSVFFDKSKTNTVRDKYILKDQMAESTFSYIHNCVLKQDQSNETYVVKVIKKKKNFVD